MYIQCVCVFLGPCWIYIWLFKQFECVWQLSSSTLTKDNLHSKFPLIVFCNILYICRLWIIVDLLQLRFGEKFDNLSTSAVWTKYDCKWCIDRRGLLHICVPRGPLYHNPSMLKCTVYSEQFSQRMISFIRVFHWIRLFSSVQETKNYIKICFLSKHQQIIEHLKIMWLHFSLMSALSLCCLPSPWLQLQQAGKPDRSFYCLLLLFVHLSFVE